MYNTVLRAFENNADVIYNLYVIDHDQKFLITSYPLFLSVHNLQNCGPWWQIVYNGLFALFYNQSTEGQFYFSMKIFSLVNNSNFKDYLSVYYSQ